MGELLSNALSLLNTFLFILVKKHRATVWQRRESFDIKASVTAQFAEL